MTSRTDSSTAAYPAAAAVHPAAAIHGHPATPSSPTSAENAAFHANPAMNAPTRSSSAASSRATIRRRRRFTARFIAQSSTVAAAAIRSSASLTRAAYVAAATVTADRASAYAVADAAAPSPRTTDGHVVCAAACSATPAVNANAPASTLDASRATDAESRIVSRIFEDAVALSPASSTASSDKDSGTG